MENRKYKVDRDNVYVGRVIMPFRVYRYEGNDSLLCKSGQLCTVAGYSGRSMLFVLNEEKLANDLLYRSPNYPVLNITDDDICLGLGKTDLVVENACNLAELLEYFGYDKDLTYKDIMKIRKRFFTGKFAMENCELFGMKESKLQNRIGDKCFSEVSDESILSKEYWCRLDKFGDRIVVWLDDFCVPVKRNAFAPSEAAEGKVRKLTRF